MNEDSIANLKRTVYRHFYAGWLKGRRINAVSRDAALCFVHLHFICDGFGNFHADPELVVSEAFPLRRDVTPDMCQQWIDELAACKPGLVSLYEAVGETYGHITGFEDIQPAGKNGKPYQLYPKPPAPRDEDDAGRGEPVTPVNPSESKTILNDPMNPSAQKENENEKKKEKKKENETARAENRQRLDSGSNSQPFSDSGSPTDGTEASGESLSRDKAKARWVSLIVQQRMIGRDNGSTHPKDSPQYNADLTSIERLWDRVWPEEIEPADTEQVQRFNALMAITKSSKPKRKPMAWMTNEIKNQIPEREVV